MSAKSAVNFVASTAGTDAPLVPAEPELEDDPDEPHAAAVASSPNTTTRRTATERRPLPLAEPGWDVLTSSSWLKSGNGSEPQDATLGPLTTNIKTPEVAPFADAQRLLLVTEATWTAGRYRTR
jgi:hypothetical protein